MRRSISRGCLKSARRKPKWVEVARAEGARAFLFEPPTRTHLRCGSLSRPTAPTLSPTPARNPPCAPHRFARGLPAHSRRASPCGLALPPAGCRLPVDCHQWRWARRVNGVYPPPQASAGCEPERRSPAPKAPARRSVSDRRAREDYGWGWAGRILLNLARAQTDQGLTPTSLPHSHPLRSPSASRDAAPCGR